MIEVTWEETGRAVFWGLNTSWLGYKKELLRKTGIITAESLEFFPD